MFENIEYKTSKKYDYHKKTSVEYINIPFSFDIETTSTYIDNNKVAFMYLWGFGVKDENHIYYGRTWKELLIFLNNLSNEFELNSKRRIICYVHNLGYEFQFMKKYFKWLNVFAIDERKPLKALCSLGIEFRDSYLLSGYSLSKTSENLQSHNIKKLVGDLDYSLVRHHNTPVTEDELKYLHNDVLIVLYYIQEQLDIYKKIHKIPLTNTGRVREYVKEKCFYNPKQNKSKYKSSKGKYQNYREIMKHLTLTGDEYLKLKWAFTGGYTHSNSHYTNLVVNKVHSIDFTSAYPSVMIAEKFPMGKGFTPTKSDINKNGYEYYYKNFCCVIGLSVKNLNQKFMEESYLSESKCKISGKKLINNGRIVQAENLTTYITDVDYWVIDKVYEWDYIVVRDLVCYPKGYLPKAIVKSILDLYKDKTTLKNVKGKEVEYLQSKGMLNSVYGMCVTDIVRDIITYTDKWEFEKSDLESEISSYNENKNRFLFYAWGIWVTAYARRNLWTGILSMKDDYIYSDTDSIKFTNYNKHKKYIEKYNEMTIYKLKTSLEYHNLDTDLISPKTVKGVKKTLGVWDYEGMYKRFKTLGAKRYMVEKENEEIEITVSGLGKSKGVEYIKKHNNNDVEKMFNFFSNEMRIPKEETGKSTHTYIDSDNTFTVTDYTGIATTVHTKGGVHLEEVEYSLSLSDTYIKYFNLMQDGYFYKGVIKSV